MADHLHAELPLKGSKDTCTGMAQCRILGPERYRLTTIGAPEHISDVERTSTGRTDN
jgi:ferredoxin